MKRGFTLIELLVVVLIIGILSSVALPQYTKAVKKARIANMLPVFRSVYNAERVYRLNGGHSHDIGDLDIDVPTPELKGYSPYVTYYSDVDGMHYSVEFSSGDRYLFFGVSATADEGPVFYCESYNNTETCAEYGFNIPFPEGPLGCKGYMACANVYRM